MTWAIHHGESAKHASAAELAASQGDVEKALELYSIAAEDEMRALNALDPSKIRTVGITAVSAASLWYKAHSYDESLRIANQYLLVDKVPDFAKEQLRSILQLIKTEKISLITASHPILTTDQMLNDFIVDSKEKFEIEKLMVEKEKLALERDKLAVTSLIEDFKARWQELLNFENENSRWQTLYVTALILVVGWVLSNSGESVGAKYRSITDIFNGENSYLLLCLAFINAIYTLAMAYKGYQIQEIAQYLYSILGSVVSEKTASPFNSWEKWRRDKEGKPIFVRTIFYFIIGVLPTAVSGTILALFYYNEFKYPISSAINLFSYFVTIFVILSLVTALLTTRMNKRWEIILKDDEKGNK